MIDRALGSTVRLMFNTTNPDGGGAPVAPSSAFAASDIRIYKDGSATEKTSTNGITVTSPFDSIVGLHLVEIDTSNSTGDAGFWASGSVYQVRLVTAKTVATYSVSGLAIGEFSIEVQTADVRKAGGTAITQSGGRMEVNVSHIGGDAQSLADLKDFADAGYDPNANTVNAVLDSTRQQALADLAAMITGSGTADARFDTVALSNAPSGGGGGDATLAKQVEILAAIQGSEVIQVASPNVSGNLVLTQGDDYDGTANPRAQWTVTTDYTSGWTVALTIRDVDDAVVYTTAGTVVSATVVAVTIAAPTGLTMTGCPGQWQGKFDVQLTHTATGKKKTIALGTCYINEDQTR